MRVLVNLIPVQSGGGQQQAFHLLRRIRESTLGGKHEWHVLAGVGSAVNLELEEDRTIPYSLFGANYFRRFILDQFEYRALTRKFQPDVVFHFTTAWKGVNVPQVVRSVYSNLYFPEVDFWGAKPHGRYLLKKMIDRARLSGTLHADGLIFENYAMLERAVNLFGYPRDRTAYIRPAKLSLGSEVCSEDRKIGDFRILYLSSWYPNKNIAILPSVASRLDKLGVECRFVLSLDAENPVVRAAIIEEAERLGVSRYFELIGTVYPTDVRRVVESCDAMLLLSKLECFSSNVVEAWSYRRPLIVSDLEWAKAACGTGALFVDRDNPENIASGICTLLNRGDSYRALIDAGNFNLSGLNTEESKFEEQVRFLEYISEVGRKC